MAGRYTAKSDGAVYNVRGNVKTSANAASLPSDWPNHKIELYIDFANTTNLDDDQKFECYLFAQTKDVMAGITWWNAVPFGFFAEKRQAPAPRKLANNGILDGNIWYDWVTVGVK